MPPAAHFAFYKTERRGFAASLSLSKKSFGLFRQTFCSLLRA
jgi:hypothetical protein